MFAERNTGIKRVHIYYTSISRQETVYMGSFRLSIFQKMETSRISSKIFKTFFREIAAVSCFKVASINRIFGWMIHFQTSSKFWTLGTIFSRNFDFIRILGRIVDPNRKRLLRYFLTPTKTRTNGDKAHREAFNSKNSMRDNYLSTKSLLMNSVL